MSMLWDFFGLILGLDWSWPLDACMTELGNCPLLWTDSWEGLWWTSRPIVDFFGDWTVVESSDLLSDCAGLWMGLWWNLGTFCGLNSGALISFWGLDCGGPGELLWVFLRIVAKTSRSTVIRIFCGLKLGGPQSFWGLDCGRFYLGPDNFRIGLTLEDYFDSRCIWYK